MAEENMDQPIAIEHNRLCIGTRVEDGLPCGAWAVPGSDFCYRHDPEKREESLAASKKGGELTKGRQQRARDIQELAKNVQRLSGVIVEPDARTVELSTVEQLYDFSRCQVQSIVDLAGDGVQSMAEQSLLLKWCEFILKLHEVWALDSLEELEEHYHEELITQGREEA